MRKILLAACAVLALTGAARGELFRDVAAIEGWQVVAGSDHCAAAQDYENSTSLIFGVEMNGAFWVRIYNESWKIPEGQYPLKFSVDKSDAQSWQATGDGKRITIPVIMNEDLYLLLTRGAVMNLTIGGVIHKYALTGTKAMLPALLGCVRDIAKAANPFADQPAPVSTSSNPFKVL